LSARRKVKISDQRLALAGSKPVKAEVL